MNTTELIERLSGILELDDVDNERLASRGDSKFSQIVRNVVSHVEANAIVDKYGFIIDKTQSPAVFYAKRGCTRGEGGILSKEEFDTLVLSDDEVEKRQKKKKTYVARKVDFEKVSEENTILGNAGEVYAYEWEKNRLRDLGVPAEALIDEVIHVSKVYGDGCGYDILSKKDCEGSLRFIEVKTTKKDADTPFYMSRNEKSFMEEYREDAVIYRIYNFNPDTKTADVLIITQDNLEREYYLDPITYKVIKKQ